MSTAEMQGAGKLVESSGLAIASIAGPFSLEIEFKGPDSTDPAAEVIDQGVAQSYRFMTELNLSALA